MSVIAGLSSTAACTSDLQEVMIDRGSVTVGFHAGGRGVSTRTEMLQDGLSATWNSGDAVALWAKNQASSYILANQAFRLYGNDYGRAFFSAVLPQAMPEDDYTYYAVYPQPLSQEGTSVTFNLPAVQDGRVSDGADIMIATPVEHGALKGVPELEDHSGLGLEMNHILHQLRFWMPEGTNVLGEDIEEIRISMPEGICGKVTADFTDPEAAPGLSEGGSELTLKLRTPMKESAYAAADFACAAIFPRVSEYTAADSMRITVYTRSYRSELKAIPLEGRSFLAGHSTPVRLLPVPDNTYSRISLHIGANHIGEPLSSVRITSGGNELLAEAVSSSDFTLDRDYIGTAAQADYEAFVNAVSSGNAVLVYETEHALAEIPLRPSCISIDGNHAEVELGDVPYLLDEDFSNAKAAAHDDDYSAGANQDRNKGGYLLDEFMPRKGWNASRFSIIEGDCARINCRYQSGAWVVERNSGRLDTPSMSYLKPGASVRVRLEYSEAFYVPAGYNVNDSANRNALYMIGTHTQDEGTAIEGIRIAYSGSFAPEGGTQIIFTSDTFASENVANLHARSIDIDGVGSTTRFVFFVLTNQTMVHIGANACYYLYIDDIRAYINN